MLGDRDSGSRSTTVTRSQAQDLAALIPHSELRFLRSRNHILTADEPAWPVFLAEINRFLATDPTSPAVDVRDGSYDLGRPTSGLR